MLKRPANIQMPPMCPGLDLVLNPIPSHIPIILLEYIIPSLPDFQLHCILDPFHQHLNIHKSSHLKNNLLLL